MPSPDRTLLPWLLLVVALALVPRAALALAVIDPGQGPVALVDVAGAGASELSGLSYDATTGLHYAVSDGDERLFSLGVAIDPDTGRVASAEIRGASVLRDASGMPLAPGRDLEGVAFDAASASVYVSGETGPAIRQHALSTGATLRELGPASAPALGVYARVRPNLAWESLTLSPDGATLWTANEEALTGDGKVSRGTLDGTVVRLQRLATASFLPIGQLAYRVDGDLAPGWLGIANAGVSDLAALPDGSLLVLERAAGIVALAPEIDLDFRSRIYRVDPAVGTDVTSIVNLAGAAYAPASKTLLWEGAFAGDNFEGLALGGALANGDRSLLLVSDDGGGLGQSVLALRLGGLAVPEPATGVLIALGLAVLGVRRGGTPRRDASGGSLRPR